MQSRTTSFLVILASLVTFAPDARGHHSGTLYDYSRVAEVEGQVESVRWINPHAIVEIRGMNEDGVEELWKIEGDSINALQRKGFDVDSVRTGERVKVLGAMSRHGRPEMRAAVLYLADGREVVLNDRIAVDLGIMERALSTGRAYQQRGERAYNCGPTENGYFEFGREMPAKATPGLRSLFVSHLKHLPRGKLGTL